MPLFAQPLEAAPVDVSVCTEAHTVQYLVGLFRIGTDRFDLETICIRAPPFCVCEEIAEATTCQEKTDCQLAAKN
jgi:hypothetical protein